MANGYFIGDGFRLEARFTVDGVLTDPTTVTFQFLSPSDVITTYVYGTDPEVVKSAVGVYYVDVTVSEELTWWYRIVATGAVIAAVESSYVGSASKFV